MPQRISPYIEVLDFPKYTFPCCNCLLIEDDIRCLIDTAPPLSELERVKQRPVDLVINSHFHLDHRFYNRDFPESRILMHAAGHPMAQAPEEQLREFDVPRFYRGPRWNHLFLEGFGYHTTRIDGTIQEGQWFDLGHVRFQVLELPGHCGGHCGFFFPEEGFVFTVDIDFAKVGPWYANVHSSIPDFLNSIDRLLQLKPDYYVRGHADPFIREQPERQLKAYRDFIFERQRRIVDLLYSGRRHLDDLARALPIFRKINITDNFIYLFERTMIRHHLSFLEQQGYVLREGDAWYLQKDLSPARLSL